MDINICEYHPYQITVICLNNQCTQSRLACQKCLLTTHKQHIKSCVLISQLLNKKQSQELFSNNTQEQTIIQFNKDELISKERIQIIISILENSFKNNLKSIKLTLLEQESKQKYTLMKHNKEILKQYLNSYEFKQLQIQLKQYQNAQISQQQLNELISQIISDRQNLLNICANKQIEGPKSGMLSDEIKNQIVNDISYTLDSIKNLMRKDDSLYFYKSILSIEEEANIIESIKGKQFIFNDQDEVQLIYGSCILSKGIHEFQICVEYIPQEQQKQQEEQIEGLESIVNVNQQIYSIQSQHTLGGHFSNSGVFASPEYKHLHRLYIGVVEESAKDQLGSYSIMYQTQECCAVDIIRGASIGSFHFKQQFGEKVEPIQTLFQKNLKKGIIFTFKINLDENKLQLTDSENRTRYEGHLYNLNDNVKPYILVYKSNVKVTIN